MDRNYILKRILYTNYDVVKFDVITLDKAIKLISNVEDITNYNEICVILNNIKNNILSKNVKEIIEIIISNVTLDKTYNIDKVILNIYEIKHYLISYKNLYQKYINLIENH